MRTYGSKRKNTTHTAPITLKRNFISTHYLQTEKGFECKYCDYVFRKRSQETMLLHLVQKHQVGMAAINVGGRY